MRVAVVGLLLAGCVPGSSDDEKRAVTGPRPSVAEMTLALHAAREKVESEDARITSATVVVAKGTVAQPNAGFRCDSGRLLHITLIGAFPHILSIGHPVLPGDPAPDITVHAVLLTADATTGQVCEIGVRTGPVRPDRQATPLDLG